MQFMITISSEELKFILNILKIPTFILGFGMPTNYDLGMDSGVKVQFQTLVQT